MNQAEKKIEFNKAQLRFILSRASSAVNIWSRGTGKSFVIAWKIHLIVRFLPRSAWGIVGENYKQILTRTLPSTISGLEYIGYIRNKDFVVRRTPPIGWSLPYEAPMDFDHFILFKNGTGFHLISQDGGASSRGLNIDGIIADESLRLDKEKLDKQASATNRGNRYKKNYQGVSFKDISFHHGVFHFSSMPYGELGKWLLDYGKYYHESGQNISDLRNEIVQLEVKFIDSKEKLERIEIWREIRTLKQNLRFYKNTDGLLYSEADIFDNIKNVGIKYIEQQRRDMADLFFLVEILNWRPDEIANGFYPGLNKKDHCYEAVVNIGFVKGLENPELITPDSRWDSDCIPNLPLRIAVDWGAKINCLTVAQYYRSINTLRFLKNIYVKHPKILTDLAEEFCEYYKHHKDRNIEFLYDHTGNTNQPNSNQTYAEQFAKILRKNGWTVTFLTRGAAAGHAQKYLLWNLLLNNKDRSLPKIEFNISNCHETYISMKNAGAMEGRSGIEKNKKSERNPFIPQEEATHLSDTADIHITSSFMSILRSYSTFTDIVTT